MKKQNNRTPVVAALRQQTGVPYLALSFVGRLPFAMMIVGVLTFVTIELDSVALAGLLAACAGAGTAIAGPVSGGLADRVGQRPVIIGLALAASVSTGVFVGLVLSGAPSAGLAASAIVMGATTPQVAPFSRARLAGAAELLPVSQRSRGRTIAMSYESLADEASFVLGPVVVGVLASIIAPWAPLALSIVVTVTLIPLFAGHRTVSLLNPQRSTTTATPQRPGTPTRELVTVSMLLLVLAMTAVGGVFGATLTGLTASLEQIGDPSATGILYGAMSAGAIVTAVILAVLPLRFGLRSRWFTGALLSILGLAGLLPSTHVGSIAACLFIAGCGIGACLVSLFSLGSTVAPRDRTNSIIVTLQSSLVIGQAAVTALSGFLAETGGPLTVLGLGVGLAATIVALSVIALKVPALSRATA